VFRGVFSQKEEERKFAKMNAFFANLRPFSAGILESAFKTSRICHESPNFPSKSGGIAFAQRSIVAEKRLDNCAMQY
jgi:hypothetical protein